MNLLQNAISPAVRDALGELAASLDNTPQFREFEDRTRALLDDQAATSAIEAFQTKQQALDVIIKLNAATDEELRELEQFRQAVNENATVQAYLNAHQELTDLCQASAALLSERIGLPFSVKRGGCCG